MHPFGIGFYRRIDYAVGRLTAIVLKAHSTRRSPETGTKYIHGEKAVGPTEMKNRRNEYT